MDTVTKEVRSKIMSSIKCVSAMEKAARKVATQRAGCNLTHQPQGVYGKPDYANKGRKVAVFIHGCFWHECSSHFRPPKTNVDFWKKKMERNKARHKEVVAALKQAGWRVITVWEHEVKQWRRVYGC